MNSMNQLLQSVQVLQAHAKYRQKDTVTYKCPDDLFAILLDPRNNTQSSKEVMHG